MTLAPLLLLLACAAEPEPRDPNPALLDPPRPERPAAPPVVRTVEELIAHDRQWVEVHGVVKPVQRSGPPKAHWDVQIEVTGGLLFAPEAVGDVATWTAWEGRPVRLVGLLSLCGTWSTGQVAGGRYLADWEPPSALAEDLALPTDETEREAGRRAVELHCERRREAMLSGLRRREADWQRELSTRSVQ